MAKKKKEEKKPKVHKDLEGFEIKINPFGEISSSYSIDQLNEFLNKNVQDKKLVKRDEPSKDEEEFHIEETIEEEESPEEFLKRTKLASKKTTEDESEEEAQ